MVEGLSPAKFYILMALMTFTGSINTILTKLQQKTFSLGILFEQHQPFITFCMFIGESLCLILYYFMQRKENILSEQSIELGDRNAPIAPKEKKHKPKVKLEYFCILASFDLMATTLLMFSLTFLSGSVFQMFRGISIVFTAFAGCIFLKHRIYMHQVFGIFLTLFGLSLVGLNSVINHGTESTNPVLGIILLIIAQILTSIMYIFEEKLLKKYSVHQAQLVGMEGVCGVGILSILLFILYFIRCDSWDSEFKENICIKNDEEEYRFEDAIFAFKQIRNSLPLTLYTAAYIFSISFYNLCGLSVTKYATATSRAVVDTIRTAVIWLFFLIIPYLPNATQETFSWLQLAGFIILIIGALIYNEVIELLCCGLNSSLRKYSNNPEDDTFEL